MLPQKIKHRKEEYLMGAEQLGTYILDHDEKSFLVEKGEVKEIKYSSSNEIEVEGESRSEILQKDYSQHIDFKFSFDELNFENEEQAVKKLGELAEDIAGIEIEKANKTVTDNRQMRINEDFDNLSKDLQEERVNSFIKKEYSDTKDIGTPKVLDWERSKDGWGNDIVDIEIKKSYGRSQDMNDSIISIHTKSRDEVKGAENYKVKPHIHITINKNNDWGKKYSYLKQELYKKFKQHSLTSSHNVEIKRDRQSPEYKEYRVLKDRLTNFSWVVNKHEDGRFIRKQLNQYNRKNSVKLGNVEKKLNRYLELGGSYDFAKKIQINLREKLGKEIHIKRPESYLRAEQNIRKGNHRQIITEVKEQAQNGGKISERYKSFAKEVLKRDKTETYQEMREFLTASAIQEAVKNRGFHLDRNWEKVIDKQKINEISKEYKSELDFLDRFQAKEKLKDKIDNRNYLNQKELRQDMKKAGVEDIKEVSDLSEIALVYKSNKKHIKSNLKPDEIRTLKAYQDIKNQIGIMDIEISKNWEDKIAAEIYKEEEYQDKARNLVKKKIAGTKAIHSSYNGIKEGYNQLKKKITSIGGQNQNKFDEKKEEVKQQSKQALGLLSSLENKLDRINNIDFDNNDFSVKSVNQILKKHKKQIKEHKKIIDKFDKKLDKKLDKKISKNQELQTEIKSLKLDIDKLQEHKNSLFDKEQSLLGNRTVQYYANEINQTKNDIEKLENKKEEIQNQGFLSNLFNDPKEELAEINSKLKTKKTELKEYKGILDNCRELRELRSKTKDRINKLSALKGDKEEKLFKLIPSKSKDKQKVIKRNKGRER